uniref:Chalcone-flavonone isomerase family protein n=1 Tax=Boesenbergia rotunda TaxID=97729 RepID=A0A5B8TZA0_BOERO|nr:chacone isomerase [Boesenbergia rotunda]
MEKLIKAATSLPKLHVEGEDFPSLATPPGSSKVFFLTGAGVRGLEIAGTFVTFTAIGIYLDKEATKALAPRWTGRSADELADSLDFFRDIFTGAFDKFTRITMLKPLTGQQYSEKVAENCLAQWQAAGTLTDADAAAVGKFKEVFKPEIFPPGSSILFTHASSGSLSIAFGEAERAVIENKPLSEAILESIIGENGVSPAAKRSLALRISEVLKEPLGPEEPKTVNSVSVGVAVDPVNSVSVGVAVDT